MDLMEYFTELMVGLLIFAASAALLVNNVVDPAIEQLQLYKEQKDDKILTFTTDQNPHGYAFLDAEINSLDVIENEIFQGNIDKGTSRMYFRAEQLTMLPVVDTDLTSSPNAPNGSRIITVSDTFYEPKYKDTPGVSPLYVGQSPFRAELMYPITRDILFDRYDVKYDFGNIGAASKSMENKAFKSTSYGSQVTGVERMTFGGYNLTIDAGVHPVSGRPSNSVIFVRGRVPER